MIGLLLGVLEGLFEGFDVIGLLLGRRDGTFEGSEVVGVLLGRRDGWDVLGILLGADVDGACEGTDVVG